MPTWGKREKPDESPGSRTMLPIGRFTTATNHRTSQTLAGTRKATHRAPGTLALLAGGVLGLFTLMDLMIVLWPDVGRTYIDNAHLLLALGFAATTLVVVALLTSNTAPSHRRGDRHRTSDFALASIPGYSVYKDAGGDTSKADYVMIGQGGVYVAHVDDRGGTVRVDRRGVRRGRRLLKGAAVAGLLREARDLEERIRRHAGRPLPVTPIHVFTSAEMARPARSGGVWFSSLDQLPPLFDSFRQRLHPADVALVQALLGPEDYPRSEFEVGLFERPDLRRDAAGSVGRHDAPGL